MPNWKKVIVSGSDAVLNNITATGDVTVQGDIIAENYIVSSSVTYMTQSFFDGSTIFGDDGTDTHQFTGSLYLSQSSINLDYGGRIFGTTPGDINIWPATANDQVSIKGNLIAQYITSSNDILVGGTIQGPAPTPLWSINGSGLGTFDSLTVNGTVNLNGTFNNYGNGANDRHTFTGNITASNDISASGDIYGNSYNIKDAGVIALNSPFTAINFGNNSYSSQYRGTSHLFPAAITASIISASSDLYAGLDEDNNTNYKTVVYNTTTGQLFYTGSYENAGTNNLGVGYIISGADGLDITNPGGPTASIRLDLGEVIEGWNTSGGTPNYLNGVVTNWSTNGNFEGVVETQLTFNENTGLTVDNNITASGDISASGLLHASLSYDSGDTTEGVVVYDTDKGRFFYTGSYGGGASVAGTNTQVQINNNGALGADTNLTFDKTDGNLRVGISDPQNIAQAGYGKQSGSHFLEDNDALITNARVPKWNGDVQYSENYVLVGLGGGTATDPATGNSYNTLDVGDSLGAGDAGNNASPILSGLTDETYLGTLTGRAINGELKIGGVYANYRTNYGWAVYANQFVQVPGSPGIAIRQGGIELYSSESYVADSDGSGSLLSPRASASAVFTLANDSSSLLLQVGKEDLRDVMFISRSGDNPRIGIGTDNPLTNFDFKDVSDSSTGTKMILRSSRPTKGGDNGDEAGRINFVIDSSSYGDIETSGSVAKILGSATSIGTDGASGKLSFEVADSLNPKEDTTEVFYLQKGYSFNPVGTFEGGVTLNGSNGNLNAGGYITAGGNITTTTGHVRADNLRIGTSTNPGTNSAIIAGGLTASGLKYPSIDGTSGQVLTTDGSGNLTFTNTTTAITASAVSASYIDLDPIPDGSEPAHKEGRIFYSAENGALSVYNSEADITLQVGQEFWKRAKNGTSNTILNGTPVRISGSSGEKPLIFPALAEDHSQITSYDNHIVGVATHDIGGNSVGFITEKGNVNDIDTSAFNDGDTLYLQTSSAGFRNTPPPFPYDIVQVGTVIRSHASAGSIEVDPREPVHFGNISGLSGSVSGPGDLWVYQSNGAWAPSKTLSGSYTISNGDLTVDGNIIANQYVVSSSVTYMTQSFSSGSTIFGDTIDDTHQFTGSLYTTGSTTHYGNLTLGPITSNAPDRKLTIAGYDDAQVEFNLHNGWGKPTMAAHYGGTLKFVNYGNNSTNLNFQFGESVTRQGSMRFYTDSDEAIKFGTNGGYPLAYIGVVEQPNNYNGGLVIKSRNGTSTVNTWTFGRYGDLDAPGHITASGNISASGDVIGATGSFDVIFGGTF